MHKSISTNRYIRLNTDVLKLIYLWKKTWKQEQKEPNNQKTNHFNYTYEKPIIHICYGNKRKWSKVLCKRVFITLLFEFKETYSKEICEKRSDNIIEIEV